LQTKRTSKDNESKPVHETDAAKRTKVTRRVAENQEPRDKVNQKNRAGTRKKQGQSAVLKQATLQGEFAGRSGFSAAFPDVLK